MSLWAFTFSPYRTTEQIRQCSLRALQGMAFPDFEQQPLQRQCSQSLL